ncbi:uncharacterized protein [Haliotis asinina]|uniref:uncharacterized protein n=1 Tax=Haliotis asinina TaxID=109174 RepID=UPI0035321A9F
MCCWVSPGYIWGCGLTLVLAVLLCGGQQEDQRSAGIDVLSDVGSVAAVRGLRKLSPQGMLVTENFPGFNISEQVAAEFLKRIYGEISITFTAHAEDAHKIRLLEIYQSGKKLPYLESHLNMKSGNVVVRYQGTKSFQRVVVKKVLPAWKWSSLELKLNRTCLQVSVDCDSTHVTSLRQPLAPPPEEAEVWVGRKTETDKQMKGIVFDVRLYPSTGDHTDRCKDFLHTGVTQVQADDSQGAVHSRGHSVRRDDNLEDRVLLLERQLAQLVITVDTLKSQNVDLSNRVAFLETCECRPLCSHGGVVYDEGQTWSTDLCTVCQCVNGRPECSVRPDIPSCQTPCLSSPCSAHGSCHDLDPTAGTFQCQCQPPYDGPTCQTRQNPCVWGPDPGSCNQSIPRYFYNRFSQGCDTFNYTGCGGNINNYPTMDECNDTSMHGACCYRRYSTTLADIVQSDQQLEIRCEKLHIGACKSLHRQPDGDFETEVISFYPGMTCEEAGCVTAGACVVGGLIEPVDSQFPLGCEDCSCKPGGRVECSCKHRSVRKEIRDMTRIEMVHFQNAVRILREDNTTSVWETFRDLYMTHSMHASGGAYFLPWHRYFLRDIERKLQEVDCDISIPYFDFTTDIGKMANAIVWQPSYFGGDGEGLDNCVSDLPFGDRGTWKPCVMRSFNTSVNLPSQLELSLALASEDYMEMSLCLETYAAYLHTFIGGDMATTSSVYDPVFLAIHAYIDHLYWTWQQKDQNMFKFPAAFGSIPMIPFNVAPRDVFDLDNLCVTYAQPSKGHPCNKTDLVLRPSRSGVQRGDINPELAYGVDNYDQFGYSDDGYDRIGYDIFGYDRDGFNRDGVNRYGYDVNGIGRFGFDRDGYDIHGFNIDGLDRSGNPDTSGRFGRDGLNQWCLTRGGLNPDGFDKYGFSIHGYDAEYCNYLNNGPYATIYSQKIFDILKRQGKGFLMSLPRICPGLEPLPSQWVEQYWATNIKDVTGMVPVNMSIQTSLPSARFCFDVDQFISPCPCDKPIATCTSNPCAGATCRAFPGAQCHVSFCGECSAQWFYNNMLVDCQEERDFCNPNPCEHGGTCMESIWINEPHLVTCICPPGYDGHLCQYEVEDTCTLPISTGGCSARETRWYFDYRQQKCLEFIYTGCGGNSNNFANINSCQARCLIGACCYREPLFPDRIIGYDRQGYDRYGFNIEGLDRSGRRRTVNNGIFTARERYDTEGFDFQGYDIYGYDDEGYDRQGYDKEGFDREGFNRTGYSRIGEYDGIIDYNMEGYDPEGFNRAGYNCHGFNREGLDIYGVSAGFMYSCRSMTLQKCQATEARNVQVVQFTPGKRCEEVTCGETCGCMYNNQTYKPGDTFQSGCQTCSCTEKGVVVCVCDTPVRRKEVRELTREERERYQLAIRKLMVQTGRPSKWLRLAQMYASHLPQAVGNDAFLPWHRYYLWHVEQSLQDIDCRIAIPYYDWTIDAGKPERSLIWGANMFGGNGMNVSDCVTYHPFKNYFPPYWSPCLRRRFDTSINLPDLVNVQLALREPSFQKFRLRMEVYTKLFQTFVGGHMSTSMSAYDPVFLSLIAFIDSLWDTWQQTHSDGLLRYPQGRRYLPMIPFKVTPDNVMDLRIQMCVEYLPLTQGAPCNETEVRNYGYDVNGFDRHGYSRAGYDVDGYDVHGVSIDGNLDDRGIYDIRGYNRRGYGRSGYDMSGLDEFGFYVDTYNMDGFDANGYDRSGYDRYGFNRSGLTPFGFHKNASYLGMQEINMDAFDSYGFNKYGYDKYGFDREGYDRFGFDSKGYDRRICNFYNLGPLGIVVSHYVRNKLNKFDNETLRNIKRICPPVTSLPDWQVTNNWLDRGDQVQLIETIERLDARTQEPGVMVRNYTVDKDLIWVPLPPDEQLCLVTHVYNDCPLDNPAVLCPDDLCEARNCPAHPTAACRTSSCGYCHHEWYDGVTGNMLNCSGCYDEDIRERREGETWNNGRCQICICLEGLTECTPKECPPVTCQHPITMTDACCLSCEAGCSFKDNKYLTGTRFPDPEDACVSCVCEKGNVSCSVASCPNLGDCQSPTQLDGECCPVCLDCGDHANATKWYPSPCQECSCVNGEVSCQRVKCNDVECLFPYTPDGSCCPVCVACFYEGAIYQDGEKFKPDACQTCGCHRGNIICDIKDCPATNCPAPVTPANQCCAVCDSDCEYEGSAYKHRTTFTPSYNPCLQCSCDNSIVRCNSISCAPHNLPCQRPVIAPGECCPSRCPQCIHDGSEYNDGETWSPAGIPCQVCHCRNGIVTCRTRETCALECTHGLVRDGACCSACTDCMYDSRIIQDGETFVRNGSPCQQCQCKEGNIECQLGGLCPPLPCKKTETPQDQCCPRCAECTYEGRTYRYGEMITKDKCSHCVCREGQVTCDRVPCPQLRCSDPQTVPGACCPVCSRCEYFSKFYEDGQTFVSPRDPCESCLCKDGQVACRSIKPDCPTVQCTHPGSVRNQCCRQCDNCLYLRRMFRNGQKFTPPGGDQCQTCVCRDGSVTCDKLECPELNCLNPYTPTGHCCPICQMSCEYGGQEYREGQTFPNPRDECSVCTCRDSRVDCEKRKCPSSMCLNPATLPGDCCPSCEFCLYDRRIFRNHQHFINPSNLCEECVCNSGSVMCTMIDCPKLPCDNPMPMVGQCCFVCPKSCTYQGLSYEDGQTFRSPRNKCEECLCRQGRVQCQRDSCARVSCRHPAEEGCCRVCNNCFFKNQLWRNGQKFPDPQDECSKCRCQNGEVSCQRQQCPPVSCRNPVTENCCPVCRECEYQGRRIGNGQTFTRVGGSCETCVCVEGNVECQRKMCQEVTCQHPIERDCCKECTDCFYNGRPFNNGQSFPDTKDRCKDCRCVSGSVICEQRVCPRAPCKNPVKTQGHCCPRCSDCEYEGQRVRNGLRVPHISDPCMECECRRGNMECFKRRCRDTICRNPVTRGCCQECNDCLYNGMDYSNRQTFLDPTDRCKACSCVDGNIICSPKQCPRVTCLNPMQGECCQECSNCLFQGAVYDNGQEFPDSSDTCSSCYCKSGNVECTRKPCANVACSHPIRDGCCPVCDRGCRFEGSDYRDKEKTERDCQVCTCTDGNMRCFPKYCPPVKCSNPVTVDCCPVCGDCMFEDRKFRNGQTFPDVEDPCSECVCRDGTFKCSKKSCPAPKCQNPAQGQCCPECRNCELKGITFSHGQRFPAETDPCSTCVCQLGTISCDRHTCDKVSCEHPVIDSCGCSTCRQCSYWNATYRHNQEFPNPEDKCSTCQCRGGTVQCFRQECQSKCSHPAQDNGCCPDCHDCLYEGNIHKETSSFVSDVDPCQQCTCMGGSIICQTITCPPVSCMTPVQLPNECCPTCPVCQFLGQTYPDDSRFQHPEDSCQSCTCKMGRVKCEREQCIVKCTHPRQDLCCPLCTDCFFEDSLYRNGQSFQPDPCRRCSCRDGNVVCEEEKCPALTCLMKETPPGQCCEKCKGCEFRDTQYDTGAMWILPENPCISCTCSGGLVTCMEVDCYVPCDEPVQVPGQCCPVCPTCNFEGRRYKNGEGFTPNGDPCDYCTCEDGHLRCVHEACPSTANCPPEQLVAAAPGECCPSCSGFGTTCTRTEIGRRTHPRPEEPCFYCECKEDFQWECMKKQCKPLSCPPTVQIFTRGQCCPKCPPCYDQTEGKYYKEGDVWSAADNQCVTCRCERSEVRCSLQECPPLQCTAAEQLVPDTTGCCEVCQPVEDATCAYYDTVYQPGDEWPLDECTRCKCIAGKVKCAIKKCPILDCTPDEVAAVTPGNCCPVCLKQPGTCIVFGDPHYRSFDGTTIHFQGMCRYIMAADCENNNFTVEVQHDGRDAPGDVSWAQNFTITMSDIVIEMLQNHAVKVNGRVVELPFLYGSRVQIEMSGSTVLLNTDIGLKFLWNGDSYAELSVTGSYKRKLCGLCGNFNGFPHDDLRTKFGQITNSPAVFGNSWKAKKQLGAECDDAADVDPCTKAGYRTRKIATAKCSIITSQVFSRCHKVVSPEPFFSSCVYDMCACADNPNCLCDILASYAHECAKAKVKVQWRTNNLCAFECPPDTGLMFDDCGPVCPRTCENLDTPLGNLEENCYKPCVASCQCPANMVLHGGRCITHDKCPKLEKVTEEELS